MADNGANVTAAYAAFGAGDLERLGEVFDSVLWHVPGRSRIAGDKKGWGEIAAFFGTLAEVTAGTFHVELDQVVADGDTVVSMHTTHGERPDGARLDSPGVLVWRFEDGKAVEIDEYFADQYAEDEFWS